MSAPFDLAEQALDDVRGANILPVFFWKVVEGQAGFQVTLQAFDPLG